MDNLKCEPIDVEPENLDAVAGEDSVPEIEEDKITVKQEDVVLGKDLDSLNEEENDSDDKKDDPYAYLNRNEFSSENFKIEIQNLPRYYAIGQLKKFLTGQGVAFHKIKMMPQKFSFVTFRCEADREKAMIRLQDSKFKGRTLTVRLAKALQDPLIKKRKAETEGNGEEKKAKIEGTVEQQITKVTLPFGDKPYPEQLESKKKQMIDVLSQLTREIKKANYGFKKIIKQRKEENNGTICPLVEVLPSPAVDKYRNKCEFTVGINPDNNELTVGFRLSSYKKGSFSVGPIHHLRHLPDCMKSAVKLLEDYFKASGKKAFDAEDHSGTWRQVLMRCNLLNDVMAVITIHPQDMTKDEIEAMKTELIALVGDKTIISSLYFQTLTVNKSGEEPAVEHLTGLTHITEKMCGLEFAISPLAFFQVNTLAAELLYNKIGELAETDSKTNILDVCCGTGTIGLSLAKKSHFVYGVEIIESAVEDAKKNAVNNGIENAVFVAGKAEEVLSGLIKQIDEKGADGKIVAILDPPRAGLHRRCCQVLRTTEGIDRLIYVACNAQAAMKSFVDLCRTESNVYGGDPFIPTKAIAVDLFPDTPHCELILVLERFKKSC